MTRPAATRPPAVPSAWSGDFPVPVARQHSPNLLWSWPEAETWFEHYEFQAVPTHAPKLSPDFLAEMNDRLDLRERLRTLA